MFSQLLIIAATSIAAVHACTGAGQLASNPISQPSMDDKPTIGQAFTIEWNTAAVAQGSTLTLSLYNGCPNNCKEITDVAGGIQNTGSHTWTPDNSLAPGDDYGILFIQENPCMTAWAYFGLNPVGTAVNTTESGPSSAASAASSATSRMRSTITLTTTLFQTSYAAIATSSSAVGLCAGQPSSAVAIVSTSSSAPANTIKAVSTSTLSSTTTGPSTAIATFAGQGTSIRPASVLGGFVAILVAAVAF